MYNAMCYIQGNHALTGLVRTPDRSIRSGLKPTMITLWKNTSIQYLVSEFEVDSYDHEYFGRLVRSGMIFKIQTLEIIPGPGLHGNRVDINLIDRLVELNAWRPR